MKKIFLSIAIAALATLEFTSCGNAENTGEGTDTTAVEQAEQVNEEEIPIDSLKELQNDHYLIKIPEGWKANSRMVNNSCAMGFKESPFTSCSANFQTGTIDEFKKEYMERKGKALPDITVGDKTFSLIEYPDPDGKPIIVAGVPQADGVVTLRLFNGANMMEEKEAYDMLMKNVNLMINSITLK